MTFAISDRITADVGIINTVLILIPVQRVDQWPLSILVEKYTLKATLLIF